MTQNDRRFLSAEPAGESTGSNAGEVLKVADRGCGGCESLGIEDYNRYNLILPLESDPAHQTWRETQAVSTPMPGSKPVSVIFFIYTSTNTSSEIKLKNGISVE
jgi:hypothetical protein